MEKKTPRDYAQVKFRPGKEKGLEAEIASRSEKKADSIYSKVTKRDISRLYCLYRLCLPTFTEAEALLIANALNGAINHPESVHLLYAEVDSALEEASAEGINRSAFVARLRNLSRFECMAIADAVERAWNTGSYHVGDLPERLRKVGLVLA